jgi:hypothetical protein
MAILLNDSAFKALIERKKYLLIKFEKNEIDSKTFTRLFNEVMYQINEAQKTAMKESIKQIAVVETQKVKKEKKVVVKSISSEDIKKVPDIIENVKKIENEIGGSYQAKKVEALEKNEQESSLLGSYRTAGLVYSTENEQRIVQEYNINANSFRAKVINILIRENNITCINDVVRLILRQCPLYNKKRAKENIAILIYLLSSNNFSIARLLRDYHWDNKKFKLTRKVHSYGS